MEREELVAALVVVVYVQSWAFYLLDVVMKLAVREDFTWWRVTQFMSYGV